MNERIKELAEQARLYSRSFTFQQEVFEKKFAELIVRECVNAVQVEKDTGLYNNQQMAGMSVSKAVIKDHFGVEE